MILCKFWLESVGEENGEETFSLFLRLTLEPGAEHTGRFIGASFGDLLVQLARACLGKNLARLFRSGPPLRPPTNGCGDVVGEPHDC
ncbi:hypothetical protein BaRGS_00003056 [Batillaria attramentaria]|uniref:Uncharacterized protein n=1 Tax=Batillaria attramentaria TaxID=370345 RepID=A0ABD0M2J0_9CAEN